jgi:hypothetical protein
MIELTDTFPEVDVQPAEYKRLLGYPRDYVLSGRARELADWARAWYAKNGKPWVYARQADTLQITNGSILINTASFSSKRLQHTLQAADADGVILVAIGAGPEIETEANKLWLEEKPDEYFFLEIFGSAVVEYLTTMTGARLCAWADRHGMAVLPHYSPGYPEWDIAQQPRLFDLVKTALPGKVEVMESGMLRPKKSLLAVFGLTHQTDRVRRLTELTPCENCSFLPCQFRRSPYVRAPEHSQPEPGAPVEDSPAESLVVKSALDHNAKYIVNAKALERWGDERLKLTHRPDGGVDAIFVYDGTTCSNMGRPLTFHYHVKLGPRRDGYPILAQTCVPAPGDTGHTFMCRYMSNPEHLMVAIDNEKPLLNQPLNDILTWQRPTTGAGCYCEPNSRKHKWGLVLETIHSALVRLEKQPAKKIAQEVR